MRSIKTGKKEAKSRVRKLRDELFVAIGNWIMAYFVLKEGLIKRDGIH